MRDRSAIYREILTLARRRVGEARFRCDRERLLVESGHLGLIVRLISCWDERVQRHYLELERPRFVRACGRRGAGEFEGLWAELEAMLLERGEAEGEAEGDIPFAAAAGPLRLGYESRAPAGRNRE